MFYPYICLFSQLNVDNDKFGKPRLLLDFVTKKKYWTTATLGNFFPFGTSSVPGSDRPSLLEPSFHGHRADISPPPVQVACGLLDGVTLGVGGTRVAVVQQDLAQVEDRGHARAVLLYVSLQVLRGRGAPLKSLPTRGKLPQNRSLTRGRAQLWQRLHLLQSVRFHQLHLWHTGSSKVWENESRNISAMWAMTKYKLNKWNRLQQLY